MAGFAVQTVLLSARHKFGAATSLNLIHVASYSGDVHTIKNPKLSQLRRGTGGRSSFNGIVATVFGASGFLGRYVCNRLGKIGTQLIIPYRGDHYDVRRLKIFGDLGQVLFVPYDLRDEESVQKAVKYSNVVINLVGRDWETKNFKFDDVHVKGARTIATAACKAGVEKLIHVSALNASENPAPLVLRKGSKFFQSKWRGECAVREVFPEAIIFRPSDIYGQEDRFLRYYAHAWRKQFQAIPLWKKGECTIKQPVFVSDVAAGIVRAVKDRCAAGKVFQAVGPKRYLLSELVDWFHRVMRRDAEWGYSRYDMKYDPTFSLRVTLTELLCPGWPFGFLHWEGIEKEHTTDTLECGVPTLEDLGVSLTHMEDQVPWELKPYRAGAYYYEAKGEFPPPAPPNSIPV